MPIICDVCKRQYYDRSIFVEHFLSKHSTQKSVNVIKNPKPSNKEPETCPTTDHRNGISICVCDICFRATSNIMSLSSHVLSHVGAMPYFCQMCSFATLSKQMFRQHMKHSREPDMDCGEHDCDLCDGTFSSLTELVCHYANHLKEMPFSCSKCSVMFSEKKDFIIHNHLHKDVVECDICHFVGSSHLRLLLHVVSHNPTKFFKEIYGLASSESLKLIGQVSGEPKNTLISEGNRDTGKLVERTLRKNSNMAIVKPMQTSPRKEAKCGKAKSSSNLLQPSTSHEDNSDLNNQPESIDSVSHKPKKSLIVVLEKDSSLDLTAKHLKDQNNQPHEPSTEAQNSSSSNESSVTQNSRSRGNHLKNQNDQPIKPSIKAQKSCSSKNRRTIRSLHPRVKDHNDQPVKPSTEILSSNSSNERNRIRSLRPRITNQKPQNNIQKMTRCIKSVPVNALTPYQTQSTEQLLEKAENSTATVDPQADKTDEPSEICIAKNVKLCKVVLERLPDFEAYTYLLDYFRYQVNSKPESSKSKVKSPSLINVDNIKTEIISDDEVDFQDSEAFQNKINNNVANDTSLLRLKIAHVTNELNCKDSETSIQSPFCSPDDSDCFKTNGEENTSKSEKQLLKTAKDKFVRKEESLIKSFATLNEKSVKSKLKSIIKKSKLKTTKKKRCHKTQNNQPTKKKRPPLSKILPKPAKSSKEAPNKEKKTVANTKNMGTIKLHRALADHNYFSVQGQNLCRQSDSSDINLEKYSV